MIPKNIFDKVQNNIGPTMVDNFDSVGINHNCGNPDLMNFHRGVNLPNRTTFIEVSCPTMGEICAGCVFTTVNLNSRVSFTVFNDGSLSR